MIVEQLLYLRFLIAERARRVLPDRKGSKLRFQCLVNQKLTDQGFPFPQDKLNDLRRLNQSNLPGHNSQDTGLVSAGDQTRGRRFWKETAQARTSNFGGKDAGLTFKLENTSVDIRFSCKEGGIIHEILRWEVVRPIQDDVKVGENFKGIL